MLFGEAREFVFCAPGHAWVSIKGDSAHSLIIPCRGLLTLSKRLEKRKYSLAGRSQRPKLCGLLKL